MSTIRARTVEDPAADAGHHGGSMPARQTLRPIDDRPAEAMNPEHREAVARARSEIGRGEIATDEEVEAAFHRFDS